MATAEETLDLEALGVRDVSRFERSWPWLASVALHVVLLGAYGFFAFRSLHAREVLPAATVARPPGDALIAIDLPGVADGTLLSDERPDPKGEVPVFRGGDRTARLDTGAAGRGGERAASEAAVNLSDRDDQMRLSPDLVSRLDRDQQARIHSATTRQSYEDRRSTTHPMELTFLASGKGVRAERREPTPRDPSRGGTLPQHAAVQGGAVGKAFAAGVSSQPREPGDAVDPVNDALAGAAQAGVTRGAAGLGVHDAAPGARHRAEAAVMHARPDVTLATVSIPSELRGRPSDDIDSEQDVATTLRSLVHASTAGGLEGAGTGGSEGGPAVGSGGTGGEGSRARPLGAGDSEWFDLNTNDPRLVPYFRRIHAKVDPLWADAFPKSALLDLRQGLVIFEVTLDPSGNAHVAWPPVRPSGIEEFDRNCLAAIMKASPFGPIPAVLGATSLRVRMPFEERNPIIK